MGQKTLELLYAEPNKIMTYTGKFIDPFFATPEDIELKDIAWGLAHTFRFRGNTAFNRPLTVAEHSCHVANRIWNKTNDPFLAMAGLMHDASEAYIADIPTPIKKRLPSYEKLEDGVMFTIWCWLEQETEGDFLNLPHKEIKKADKLELEREWENVVLNQGTWEPPLSCPDAFVLFQDRYYKYLNAITAPKSKDV